MSGDESSLGGLGAGDLQLATPSPAVPTDVEGEATEAVEAIEDATAPRWALIAGGSVLVLLGAVYVAALVGFALGASLSGWVALPGLAAQIAFVFLAWREADGRGVAGRTVLTLVVCWFVLLGLGLAASRVVDVSTDGRHYHGESIWALDEGWNPVRDPPLRFAPGNPEIWSNSYPKASWVLEATVIKLGGDFESSKLVNAALMLASALIAFALLAEAGLGRWTSAVVAVVLALNPVASFELGSHMVDGIVASLCLMSIALALLWLWKGSRLAVIAPLGASILLLVNVKFTGVLVAVLIVGGVLAIGGVAARLGWRRIVGMLAVLGATVGVSVIVFGFNPYVTNTLRHDSPLYPVAGPNSRTIDERFFTGSMRDQSSIERLVRSVTSSSVSGDEPHLKLPLTFTRSEWSVFRGSGARFGGFGPFFSGAFILAFIGALAVLVLLVRRRVTLSSRAWGLVGATGCCLVSVLIMPDSFVSRFAPQLWLVAGFAFAVMLLVRVSVVLKAIAWIGVVILLVNGLGVAGVSSLWNIRHTNRDHASVRALKALPVPLDAEFGVWPQAEARRLRDHGIRYQRVAHVSCKGARWFPDAQSLGLVVNATKVRRPVQGVLFCPATTATPPSP
jgi:hypothetical protein